MRKFLFDLGREFDFRLRGEYLLPALLLFGIMCVFWAVFFYIPIYLVDLKNLSEEELSMLLSLFPLTSLLTMFIFGFLSDRFPPQALMRIGLLIFAAFLSALKFGTTFSSFIPLFVLGGMGRSLFQVSCYSYYYKILGEADRGKKLGFFQGIGLYGYGIGPLVGGRLLANLSFDKLLLLLLIALIPLFLLTFALRKVEPARFGIALYRRDLQRREVLVIALLVFIMAMHLGAEQTSLSLFLKHHIFLTDEAIGRIFGFVGLAIGSLSILDGFAADYLIRKRRKLSSLLYLGLFCSGLFNILTAFTSSFKAVLLMRLLHVFGDSMFGVGQRVVISGIFPKERIGGDMGIVDTLNQAGLFAGLYLSGFLPGYALPFIAAGALAIFAIPLAASLKPRF